MALVAPPQLTPTFHTSPLRDIAPHLAKQFLTDTAEQQSIDIVDDTEKFVIIPKASSNSKSELKSQQQQKDKENEDSFFRHVVSVTSSQILHMFEIKSKKKAFTQLVRQNRRFLQASIVHDGFLLSFVYVYFQKLGLTIDQYTNSNLYCGLYLAVAMEEDSEEGIHEVLVQVVGVSKHFMELDYTNVPRRTLYEDHQEWRKELHAFYAKVNKFWAALNFNSHVSFADAMNTHQMLATESSLFKPRKPEMIAKLAEFW